MSNSNNRIERLRDWLNINKIFFETIVAIFLAGMAITLTIMSITVSIQTNEIAFYETELMKMENQPIFRFDVTYDTIDFDQFEYPVPADEMLIINNIGKPLKEFSSKKMIFLKMGYLENGINTKLAFVPITYYIVSIPTGDLTNELMTFRGPYLFDQKTGNRLKVLEAGDDLSEYVHRLNANDSVSIDILRYIKVEYTDIFGNIHEDIYFVDSMTGASKLNENDGVTISKYYKSFMHELDVSELSPSILYENLLTYENRSKELTSMGIVHY